MMKPVDDIIRDLMQQPNLKMEQQDGKHYKTVKVNPQDLLALMRRLNDYGFNYLANLTAADYGQFELVYHLHCIPEAERIAVKVRIPRAEAVADSVTGIWPTADWQEREIYDLLGISFIGHPNLSRILLPQDFSGHPLRKDFTIMEN